MRILCSALLFVSTATGVLADQPETVPPGMVKYVMVLWSPGMPLADGKEHVKKVDLPDVAKFGGRVAFNQHNYYEIYLPKGRAKQLRDHPAIMYLQRVWMGEAFDDVDDLTPPSSRARVAADADTNLEWERTFAYDGSGNIKSQTTDDGITDNYVYDSAGRLVQASVDGSIETYEYDAFGNLVEKGVQGAATSKLNVHGSSNRIIGAQYDLAGNLTSRDTAQAGYVYDALSMIRRIRARPGYSRRLLYDADDEQLAMLIDNEATSNWTIRDFAGRVIREFRGGNGNAWTWRGDRVYANGALVAGETQWWQDYTSFSEHQRFVYGGVRHYHLDHLGSVRVVTGPTGKSLSEHDFYPYGVSKSKSYQEPIPIDAQQVDAMRFAGHSREFLGFLNTETTDYLDYMHARYYDPNLGRFLSVDPTWESADLGRPQSWNRYSYVLNNPINYTDPDGRCPIVLECVALGALGKAVFVVGTTLVVGAISETEVNGKPISTHVGEFLLSGGGSSGEMAAETMVRNYAAKQAEEAEPAELPVRDSTGKVHGELPTPADLREHSTDDLKQFQEELKGSVGRRIDVTSQLGPDKAHGERQAAEQRLIKQIDKIIKDREPK